MHDPLNVKGVSSFKDHSKPTNSETDTFL